MKNGPYELIIAPAGYPGKRYRNRYAYEHIVQFWLKTGRMPLPGHVVHHVDENKRNNSWSNLEEKSDFAHKSEHAISREPKPRAPIVHGTIWGYRGADKCRCVDCRAANAAAMRAYRETHPRRA